MGAFSESTIRNNLAIPDNIDLELILTVGYELPKGKTKQKIKYPLTNRVFFDVWSNKFHKPFVRVRRVDV